VSNPDFEDALVRSFLEGIHGKIAEQPWYERFSNTVAAAAAAAVTFAGWAASVGLNLPEPAQFIIGGLLFVATVLTVKQTRNGLTESLVPKLTDPKLIHQIAAKTARTARDGVTTQIQEFTDRARDAVTDVQSHVEGLSASVGSDIQSRAEEMIAQLRETTTAATRTGFAQLPDGTRARIQLSVTPER